MKTLVKNYTFNPASKQITITNLTSLDLEQLLLITNVTDNIMIYNFADPSIGASVNGNVITLDYNTAAMDAADDLQIFIDIPNSSDLETLGDIMIGGFASIVSQLESMKTAQGFPDAAGRLRVNVETGGTISAVSTVSNISSMDGYNQRMMLFHLSNGAVNPLRDKIKVYSGMI